jgi:hypothetical protein
MLPLVASRSFSLELEMAALILIVRTTSKARINIQSSFEGEP